MSNKPILIKTAGVILAGGKSRRMSGQHKGALLTEEGKTFTEHIASEMHKLTDSVYLSYGDMIREEIPDCKIVRDIYPDCGPTGGLHAALNAALQEGAEAVLTSACDMPFVTADLYVFLYDQLIIQSKDLAVNTTGEESTAGSFEEKKTAFDKYDGVVCTTGEKLHPLSAIYSVRAAATFEEQLIRHDLKVIHSLDRLHILYVDVEGTKYESMLFNINTGADYEKYCKQRSRYLEE